MYRAVLHVYEMPFVPECFPRPAELACAFFNRTLSVQGTAWPQDLYPQLLAPVRGPGSGNVQSRTVGVRKCRLCQSASHGRVNWHVSFQSCTPSVQGTMVPPSLSTQLVAPVRAQIPKCTEPYSGFTKMPFTPECFPWHGEQACVF